MKIWVKVLITGGVALFTGLYGGWQFGYSEETIVIISLITLFGLAISLTQVEIVDKLDEIKKKCSIKMEDIKNGRTRET